MIRSGTLARCVDRAHSGSRVQGHELGADPQRNWAAAFLPCALEPLRGSPATGADALDAAGSSDAAIAVRGFQFRDLRAKPGTDKADSTDLREAQQQLGHKSVKTTEIYLRARAGEKVTP